MQEVERARAERPAARASQLQEEPAVLEAARKPGATSGHTFLF